VLSFDPTTAALIGLMMGVVLTVTGINETRGAAWEGLLQGLAECTQN
jgi:hypothetical protein